MIPETVPVVTDHLPYQVLAITAEWAPDGDFPNVSQDKATLSLLEEGLRNAIDRSRLMDGAATQKTSLNATIKRISVPTFARDLDVSTLVSYEIRDITRGTVLYSTNVEESGSATTQEAFVARTRASIAVNRAFKANILKFIAISSKN